MNVKPIKSIKHKTILTFSIFSIFLIVFMWLFQAIYFSTLYENVKASELEYTTETVADVFKQSPNYEAELLDLSLQKDVGIIIFVLREDTPILLFNSSREYDANLNRKLQIFLYEMSETGTANFVTKTSGNLKILNCGKMEVINGQLVYFYVSAPVVPVTSTTTNFRYLLFFISIGVFSATLIGSYILSSQLSLPIIRMANKAKQLTNSNMNVKFNSNEYAEVKQLSDTLNYAIGELQKTDDLRKEVIANVSHELKTPLTMIKSYTELIRDISGENPEKRKAHLEIIHSEAEHLEFLINDMMDYSKLESGVMAYNKTVFNLTEILAKHKNSFSEKYSAFKITLSAPKIVMIEADQKRIGQVITNLLNNAINYSTTKKLINIRLKKLDNQPNKYQLDIVDHGMGISEENLEHIFERHFRTTTAKRTTVGSGIGLSIVKSILDAHGFSISVSSTEGKGSTFHVIFTSQGD